VTNFLSQRDLVLISFPYSDMTESKVRPVIVLSNDKYNKKFSDFIAIPLTSNLNIREHVLRVTKREMEDGFLVTDSNAEVDKITSIKKSCAEGEDTIRDYNPEEGDIILDRQNCEKIL